MKKDDTTLRVGILGCGPISQFAHLESAQKARNVTLHAVCDADESLAQRFGTFYDAEKIYLDYDEMLADDGVDAVIIAVSDAFHVPAAMKALAAGKHVLCEKPLGTNVREVEALARGFRRRASCCKSATCCASMPGIPAAHEFIRDEIGQLLALEVLVLRFDASLHHDRCRATAASYGRTGPQASRRSKGGQSPVLHADAWMPSGRPGALSRRTNQSCSCALIESVWCVLLVRRDGVREWRTWPSGSDGGDSDGLV